MKSSIDRDIELLYLLCKARTYQEMVGLPESLIKNKIGINKDNLLYKYEILLNTIELKLREYGFTYESPPVVMSEVSYTNWANVIENVMSTEGTKDKRKLKKRHKLLRDCLFYHKHWLDLLVK